MAFSQPNAGSTFAIKDYVGALLLVYPRTHEQDIETSFGKNDAIRADLVVLDGPNNQPEVHVDVLLFQRALIGQLRSNVGRDPVLGRVTTGVAKPGMNPPYRLDTYTADDAALATKYLAAHPDPFAEPSSAPAFVAPQPAAVAANSTTGQPAGAGVTPEVAALLAQLTAQQQGQPAQPPF